MSAREKDAGAPSTESAAPSASTAVPGRSTLGGDGADGLEGSGLPYKQKSLFQASLGTDLSNVRVRTDKDAAKKADAHDARAYAEGDEINFAAGEYQPGTPQGDRLLAHEVAHTVQQRGAPAPTGEVKTTTPGDSAEKGADTAAAAMVAGKPASVESEPIAIAKKGRGEDIAPPEPTIDGPETTAPPLAPGEDGKTPDPGATTGRQGELDGDLSVERVGAEEVEGTEAVGPRQNLEAGKAELAGKAKELPPDGGAEELKAGGPKVEGGDGGGGGPEVQMTEDVQLAIQVAQADAKEGAAEAQAEATAYKAAMSAERDRFDAQQEALTLEQLKAMTPADKRSTMIEMGYDEKSVKKMDDAEIDGIITGKMQAEQRKTRILGMDPEELRALTPDRKMQFLVDLGVDRGDLQKIGPQKTAAAFDQVISQAHVPGQHKVKIKIKGGFIGIGKREWEIKLDVDAEGNPEFDVQKKGGWLSKLWGWVKAALPIIALVLAPLTGGASLIALAVYQTVTAIASGDWLGAIIGAAGAIVGLGALKAISSSASNAAQAFKKVADVAGKVKNVAIAAKASMMAAKAKSPGGLLAALSTGASAFADFAAKSAEKFAATMKNWATKLEKWGRVISGGEQVVQGIKSGDPAAAIAGAFEGAAAAVSKQQKQADGTTKETSKTAQNFERYSRIATYASVGQRAAKSQPPDYGGIVDAAMNIAGEFKTGGKFETAQKITGAASRLTRAIQTKNPGEIAAAALGLAEQIQLARVDDDASDAKGTPEQEKAKITERYSKAASIVRSASAAITAAAQKPRPNYPAALEAATQLIADLTENKKVEQASVLIGRLDAWTSAVKSKNEQAIIDAGIAFGAAINGMKDLILADRDAAKKAVKDSLPQGQDPEGDDGGTIPSIPLTPFTGLPGAEVTLPEPVFNDAGEPIAIVTTEEQFRVAIGPRQNTPGANYTVVGGDTLSGIAKLFKVSITQLRNTNPQLDGDKIYVGQRIHVPGALTPNVTTETGDVRLAPGQTPPGQDHNGLPIPDRNVRDSGDVVKAISLAEKFGELTEWPDFMTDFLGVLKANIKAYRKLQEDGKTATDEYKKLAEVIEAAAKSTKWADAVVKKLAGYEGDFRGMIDIDGDAQAVRIMMAYARVARGAVTLVNIPFHVIDAAEHFGTMMGVKPNGSAATTIERAAAAKDLAEGGITLAGDIKWMGETARFLLPKLTDTLESAVATVSKSLSRIGGKVAEGLMTRVFRPILDKAMKNKGVAEAARVARQIAGEVERWGATRWAASRVSRTAFVTGVTALAETLGMLIGPALWVIEYYTFIATELPNWYFGARDGSSAMLSPALFGKMVHAIKDDVRRQVINTMAQGDNAIRFFYNDLFRGADSKVKAAWPQFAMDHLAFSSIGMAHARSAGDAETLIAKLDEYNTAYIARYLQTGALLFIDAEYKKEFGIAPPESS